MVEGHLLSSHTAWRQKKQPLALPAEDSTVRIHAARVVRQEHRSRRQTPHLRRSPRQTPHLRRTHRSGLLHRQTPYLRRFRHRSHRRLATRAHQVTSEHQHQGSQLKFPLELGLGHQWMDLFQMPVLLLELPHTSRNCTRGCRRISSCTSYMSSTTT